VGSSTNLTKQYEGKDGVWNFS